LWPDNIYLLMLSSLTAGCNIWLLLAFALNRAGKNVQLLWLLPLIVLQATGYTLLNDLGLEQESLHFMTLITAAVALPSAWLFWFVKPNRTVSDQCYAMVMLSWLLICVLRTLTVELSPDVLLSGYLVSQVLWPGLMAAYGLFAITGYLEEAQQRSKAEAMLDPLTGQLNRRGLQEVMQSCLAYLQRHQQPAALLMIDLDHFKTINDLYGHAVGDWVLAQIALQIKATLRQSDVLARYGGEEFLVFLPKADETTAQRAAERIRADVAALHWPHPLTPDYRQTVSIGGAMLQPGYDFQRQLALADQALYQAKALGRNRVEFAKAHSGA
jgi:diguanylate cyclase (GGDEF)-like protein